MRNFDELRAAALATGTYADYVGDGFSVPWQVALPLSLPVGYTMWAYKAYLDARWPEGARLHDWCYTPYGGLIDVGRLEADLALSEFIARDSVVDSVIVLAAVQLGGGPFFGVSQTGYSGLQAFGGIRNIELAPRALGEIDMTMKVTLLINGRTNQGTPIPVLGYAGTEHSFGNSEGFLTDYNSFGPSATNFTADLAARRAQLLPNGCSIIAARQQLAGQGQARMLPLGYSGTNGTINTAFDALMLGTRNTTTVSQRRFWLHYLPDEQTVQGELRASLAYQNLLASYIDFINQNCVWNALVPLNKTKILTITAGGIVTFDNANPFLVGQQITISRAYNPVSSKFTSGLFFVATIGPNANQCTLATWAAGSTVNGYAYRISKTLTPLGQGNGVFIARTGVRKAGRPFELYRGVNKR